MRISDWSSDVCSSDLVRQYCWWTKSEKLSKSTCRSRLKRPICKLILSSRGPNRSSSSLLPCRVSQASSAATNIDRKSVVEGKSVSVRVDLGGRRIIIKKKTTQCKIENNEVQTNK